MAVVTANGSAPKVVVVDRRSNVATVADESRTIAVASPGPQGPAAMGDNETFNDDLALLYSVAKA